MSDSAPPPPALPRAACTVVPWTVVAWPTSASDSPRSPDPAHLSAVAACVRAAAEMAARDGFVVLRGAIATDSLRDLAATAFAAARDVGLLTPDGAMISANTISDNPTAPWQGDAFTDPRWLRLQQQVLPTRAFTTVGDSSAILSVLAVLFGEGVTTRRGDICRLLAPNAPAHTTRPHQDHWYVGGSLSVWTAWIPLRDCPMDAGGIAVLAQDRGVGLLPHSSLGDERQGCAVADDARWHSSDLLAGDIVLFNCLTVHRAWHNLHPTRPRVSVDYRYQPASALLDITRADGTKAGTA